MKDNGYVTHRKKEEEGLKSISFLGYLSSIKFSFYGFFFSKLTSFLSINFFYFNVLILIVCFCQWFTDMENNDGHYYMKKINSIMKTIGFVTFICTRFDRRNGFHPDFVNEHIHDSSRMKLDVQNLYHFHQREFERKNIRDRIKRVNYHDHNPVDLNWCYFFHHYVCVLEEVAIK